MNYKAEENLSMRGEGIIIQQGKTYYLPFILPNEEISATFQDDAFHEIHIHAPSPHRIEKRCSIFTQCGGCSFQHFSKDFYQDYKKNYILLIFHKEFPDIHLTQSFFCDYNTRRRTTISLYKTKEVFKWGYKKLGSKSIITPDPCVILTEFLSETVSKIAPIFEEIIPLDTQVKIHFTEAENGIDCVIRGCKVPNKKKLDVVLEKIHSLKTPLIRIIWDGELIWQLEKPYVKFTDYEVELSPEMFLQPSKQGQEKMIEIISSYIPKKKKMKIADLFAGAGTFSMPLSDKAVVHGYDCAGDALDMFDNAIKKYGKDSRIWSFKRDLFRYPLSKMELKEYDIVVCDPPRQGMEAQAKILAQSTVSKIILICCDVVTALRDVKILTNGGYKIKELSLIDQFVFTPHNEAIILLEK